MTDSPSIVSKTDPAHILVGVAWPYCNGEQHIGHIAGAYLPPDIFARYQRMIGNKVLMVSGSDTHGTPVTIKADEEGITPPQVIDRYHPLFIESYLKLGLTFDLFTHTDTENHWNVTQDMFLRHHEKGLISKATEKQLFDPRDGRFLPDRYVEGICPKCGNEEARGDQCDNCGATYDATELKSPRSKISGNTELEVRETEHFFLELGKLNDDLLKWFPGENSHWRPHVANFTRSQLEEKSLRARPITRDLSWGVRIPLEGYDSKCFYVWYDAVIGYLSATKEWAAINGDSEAWRKWWDSTVSGTNPRSYYFIGKDNIPFHTIIWPAMLQGYGGLNLPHDVPANQYLNMAGRKFSKSRGSIISIRNVLERYQPDAWRYALTAMAPETVDVDFTWDDFVGRVNSELLAKWGNLVNRVLSFVAKRFDGKVPEIGDLDEVDTALQADILRGFESVGKLYGGVKLRGAAQELCRLTDQVNNYITQKAPFKMVKEDPAAAGTVIAVALQCITWLNTLWSPILPHSAQQTWEMLGFEGQLFGRQWTEEIEDGRGKHLVLRYDHDGAIGVWHPVSLPPGQKLGEPRPLFVKLDEKVAEEEGGS
ncbi:MAG: methionine--tRNA ligase [Candidatus Sumerlaeia bacterium]|nr:methionine--tRNA ligase [Candidatus Sumerlaeia bacterium]